MSSSKALAELVLQKRFLLAESEVRRLVLTSELQRVIAPVRWWDRFNIGARPVLAIGLPVVGFWLARRTKGVRRWVTTGLGVARLIQSLRRFIHRPSAR